ncbi:MAG: hypothetical protein PHY47_15945 [Lachnospiraceae bacterium]|nr:hypothetical protein [Lachnospiraceae bacterium]
MSVVDNVIYAKQFGYGGVAPQLCTGLTMFQDEESKTVTLKWGDPEDTYINGILISSWAQTTILRKKGSYPTGIKDGTPIVVNKVRDQYASDGYIDTITEDGSVSDFYYMAFPAADTSSISINENNRFTDTELYEFVYDTSKADTENNVEYEGKSVNLVPAYMDYETGAFNYGSFKNAFFMSRPCMLDPDGNVAYYLNRDNMALREDGSLSEIADTSQSKNAMVEFKTIWFYCYQVGTKLHVKIANKRINESYHAWMHYDRNGSILPAVYMAAYNGSLVNNKMRSLSGQPCMNNKTAQQEMSYAETNGDGWEPDLAVDRFCINLLLTLMGKGTDGQKIFGNGHYTGGSSASDLLITGTMNSNGLFWGSNGTGKGVKVFGIENYWGNQWRRLLGWINVSGTQKIKMTYGTDDGSTVKGYNLTGSGYLTVASATPGGTSGGYISGVNIANGFGIIPVTASGSSSTYLADGLWFNNSQTDIALVGGNCSNSLLCGPFCSALADTAAYAGWYFGAALSYKKPVL